ncbi:hypothetical protein [Amycolatopsis alkalitolerans]|uniref:VWA domain-containing protein n=1 Tax=Amycolatopsis alkalitolerans TaxID=2547244 RepID=A0A5C4LXV4_9PSEU|nr:hypothetical protein [Amycolatopsis alkalitolerans]TNC23710.1 hypothetical protein FG385_20310 [Amycolatopsis alkalitolerans]
MSAYTRIRHGVAGAVTVLTATIAFTACGSPSSTPGDMAANQQRLAQCDPAKPPASLVEIDGTGSSDAASITTERMQAIESIATRTAVCSGDLRVLAFSSSSAATTVLFDGPLKMDGATDNARLRRVPGAVSDVMAKIRAAYGPAVAALPQNGSDITAQYRLASEWMQQIGDSYRLDLTVFTDGFQNIGVDLRARALSKQEATALADKVNVPKLPGASVVVAGLGRIAEGTPPSAVVEGLVAYYDELCHNTGAAKCSSVTDYAQAGR